MSTKEKHSFHNKHIFIYGSHTFWSFMKFYFVHIVKVCYFFKKPLLYLYFSLSIKHCQMRTNNSKLSFTKNQRASWFSHRQLRISKFSISLARLGECSKNKLYTTEQLMQATGWFWQLNQDWNIFALIFIKWKYFLKMAIWNSPNGWELLLINTFTLDS